MTNLPPVCVAKESCPDILSLIRKTPNIKFTDQMNSSESKVICLFLKNEYALEDLSTIKSLESDELRTTVFKSLKAKSFSGALFKTDLNTIVHPATKQLLTIIAIGLGKKSSDNYISFLLGKSVGTLFKEMEATDMLVDFGLQEIDCECFLEGVTVYLFKNVKELYSNQTKAAEEKPVKTINVKGVSSIAKLGDLDLAVKRVVAYAQGTHITACLTNLPANVCTTTYLRDFTKKMASEYNLKFNCLEIDQLEKENYCSHIAVGKGATHPPRLVHLEYNGNKTNEDKKKIALLGKGIAFDSGGYNLKPTRSGLEFMKIDMAGYAAVLGAAFIISELKPSVDVMFVSALAENLISGNAYRPGDVISAKNGKTIEVGNTDAEGRLTLADGLCYCELNGANTIIDVATLTGACPVGLTNHIAGLFTYDDALASQVQSSADITGEALWRMPMREEFFDAFQSSIADMNNIADKISGGAITAAIFLTQFVKEAKHAHIDIAGPAYVDGVGATGYGSRLLANFVMQQK